MKGVNLRVIVVDDSAEVRSALGTIIYEQPDLDLLAVAAGVDDGVELVRKLQPDVVVLDVNMPDGGGLRAAREMVVAAPGARIEVNGGPGRCCAANMVGVPGGRGRGTFPVYPPPVRCAIPWTFSSTGETIW